MTHVIAERVVANSDSIFGKATLTTDESMKAMLDPSTHAANTHVCCRFAHGVASLGVERMTSSSHGRARRPLILKAPVAADRDTTLLVAFAVPGMQRQSVRVSQWSALRLSPHGRFVIDCHSVADHRRGWGGVMPSAVKRCAVWLRRGYPSVPARLPFGPCKHP